jgi:hypothetical protein
MKIIRNVCLSIVFIFGLISIIASAVSTRSIPYETVKRPPKPDNYLVEILDVSNITRPYKVIGIVEVNAGKKHNVADTILYLKKEARRMGGDALIHLQIQRVADAPGLVISFGKTSGKTSDYRSLREIWSAKVIVWQ